MVHRGWSWLSSKSVCQDEELSTDAQHPHTVPDVLPCTPVTPALQGQMGSHWDL